MAFSTKQIRQLQKRLQATHVRERQVDGKILSYIEGWYAVAEANRIFGFEGWDRETLSSQCVWQKNMEGRYGASYVTRVRLTVRAGEQVIVREGLGTGEAVAPTPGQAHDRAAKAAETDATKRALSTFGNRFGLALYGGRQQRAKEPEAAAASEAPAPAPDRSDACPTAPAQDDGARPEPGAGLTEAPRPMQIDHARRPAPAYRVSAPINPGSRGRILETVRPGPGDSDVQNGHQDGRAMLLPVTLHELPPERIPVDKSALPLGEPKRLRSPEHLRFVGRQPCLICGRQPSQAHHLRFAQPRALARKVSDEFAVPLCSFHHDEVHRTGNEFQWWRARAIDALQSARDLWRQARAGAEGQQVERLAAEGAQAGEGEQ